ncbi:rRNA maturation RNase YbeY [Candidatus Kaiserbacteria bacterium]|nr:rRNA maturation RNase YbeY [Candidatus Kaiserbacteria bacterium]
MSFSLAYTVRTYPKTLPFQKMKDDVLSSSYHLTLTFIGPHRARSLNTTYRKKTYVPNVLSFPLDDTHGEIYITPEVASREAKRFGMTPRGYMGYLFIHGLLHLKGYGHGATMEKAEKRYCTKYHLR